MCIRFFSMQYKINFSALLFYMKFDTRLSFSKLVEDIIIINEYTKILQFSKIVSIFFIFQYIQKNFYSKIFKQKPINETQDQSNRPEKKPPKIRIFGKRSYAPQTHGHVQSVRVHFQSESFLKAVYIVFYALSGVCARESYFTTETVKKGGDILTANHRFYWSTSNCYFMRTFAFFCPDPYIPHPFNFTVLFIKNETDSELRVRQRSYKRGRFVFGLTRPWKCSIHL